jgi:uncharacterized DUF497 family protein
MIFEWDENKERDNIAKHSVSFDDARRVFEDPQRILLEDEKHSADEIRQFAIGEVDGEIVTVRFTVRGEAIRIFGAGYWRKGKANYEQENNTE